MIATITAIAALLMVPQGGQGGGGGRIGQGVRGYSDMGTEETFEHILTTGDKTDWPVKCKAGEVIILRATSDMFDPGVEFCDKNNKKIDENDDEAEGAQSAKLLVYIEKDGDYIAHVKNYRNAGGGKYQLSVRRFQTQTVAAGEELTLQANDLGQYYLRIKVPKDKLISLHASDGAGFSVPIDPKGNNIAWRPILKGELVNVFDSKDDTYYARVYSDPRNRAVKVNAVVATERSIEVGKPVSTTARNIGIDYWKMSVAEGDFLTFRAAGSRALPTYFPPAVGNLAEGGQGFKIVPNTRKWADSVTIMFTKKGGFSICVPPNDPQAGYTFTITPAWKKWDGVSPIAADLPIGGTDYYAFDAPPAFISRLAMSAKTFDLVYHLFDRSLNEVMEIDDDGVGDMNASTTVSLPRGGRYYLSIGCFGAGGGGSYSVGATAIQAATLTIGTEAKGKSTSPLDGLWTLNVPSKQTLTVRLKSPQGGGLTIFNPDGDAVPIRSVELQAGDFLLVFDAEKPGTYRVWRQWVSGTDDYSLKVGPIGD